MGNTLYILEDFNPHTHALAWQTTIF